MITSFNTESATFIIPQTEIDYATFEALNAELGAYVLLEVDYETENFTKLNVDFGLIGYDDVKDANQEVNDIYVYVKEYLNVTQDVDVDAWTKESEEYQADAKAESIAFHRDWIQELKQEVVGKRYKTQERLDKQLERVTAELFEMLKA